VSYRVEIKPSARKDLMRLPLDAQERIGDAFDALAHEQRPRASRKLRGRLSGMLRVRVGDYRASYTVDDRASLITVWRIGHRSTFYKRMGQ
jgi:mRNA interferase RelE/StbE